MDLFDMINKQENKPVAERMRPQTLDEFVGQKHILDKNKMLYRAIITDNLSSVIFYGPPGTGKTTLAMIIANTTKAEFKQINAVSSGVSDIKRIVEEAQNNLKFNSKKTILFIDEIHRFNKLQQDALLPYVERGIITLIGATTENPYFEVNKALLSRSMIFELKELSTEEIKEVLIRALKSPKGLGNLNVEIEDEALEYIAINSSGDVRKALNALEMAVKTSKQIDGKIKVTLEDAYECIQKRMILYDKNGDYHYDIVSAFIKSMRGTDPDAAIYYLAKLIEAGEDPMFIARRVMICASEDVGNADPMALVIATSAANAVNMVGYPEARIILAQAVSYVACAPKSNACYLAIDKAIEDVRTNKDSGVPAYLKDAHYKGAKELNRGIGYKYPHDYNGYVKQDYLPKSHLGKRYYIPKNIGFESKIRERLNKLKEINE